jgi:alpha,alpha-trehalase
MINNKKLVYIEDYEELFVDIQTQKILVDQKSFVDSEPKYSVKEILEAYRKEKNSATFNLKDFYFSHFRLNNCKITDEFSFETIEEYIDHLWSVLTKYPADENGTLIPLPEKFVVPGGRFREIFYWDSYFTMLGLQVAKRVDLIESMVNNFAYLIDEFGFIPNGNRTYFLTRSQPPFFSLMVELLSEEIGDEVFIEYLPQLEKEYEFWMRGDQLLNEENISERRVVRMPDGEILNRYWDELNVARPEGYVNDLETFEKSCGRNKEIFRHIRAAAESGWDFSARWFADEKNIHTICTCDLVPVDLNCLLLNLEKTLEKAYRLKRDASNETMSYEKAMKREEAIQKYLWREKEKIFADYNIINRKSSNVVNLSMVYPLVFKISSQRQAGYIKDRLEKNFLQGGGLLSTLIYSGEQWDAPNGWAPLQWMTYKAMKQYRFDECAAKIANTWTSIIEQMFNKTHRLTEKYNVVEEESNASGGEYPNQYGFGWTNGVYLKLKREREVLNDFFNK